MVLAAEMAGLRDVAVVGAGAAGLSAALFAAMEELDVLVLEALASGGQELLVEEVHNYPGAPRVPGYELAQRMEQQAASSGARLINAHVTAVRREGETFVLDCDREQVRARTVILASGTEPRTLGVPGERELRGRGVSSCASCDAPFFRGKRILVAGGGDAACEEALLLAGISDRIVVAHRGERLRAQATLARRLLESPAVELRLRTRVLAIMGPDRVRAVQLRDEAGPREYREEFDAVFVFVGSTPRLPELQGLERDRDGYLVTDDRMRTAIPGLFAAGAVRASGFRVLVVAAAEGALAAHSAAAYLSERRSPR